MPSATTPTIAPIAAVLSELPTALERSLPCNKSFDALARKPPIAPAIGPAAIPAAIVSIATPIVALPGFSFAQSLTA